MVVDLAIYLGTHIATGEEVAIKLVCLIKWLR